MQLEEQEALLNMWVGFLDGRDPSATLMREFYFGVVFRSPLYRYGMAAELFDLLINGVFEIHEPERWSLARQGARGHRAA